MRRCGNAAMLKSISWRRPTRRARGSEHSQHIVSGPKISSRPWPSPLAVPHTHPLIFRRSDGRLHPLRRGPIAMVWLLPLHQIMLRITEVMDSGTETTLHVEGRIVSEWVGLLQEECWRVLHESSRRLRLDLGAVTFIDPRGVLALRWLTTEGVALVNSPAFIDALLNGDGQSWAP